MAGDMSVWTVVATIVGGTTVFVVGQFFLKVVIEPIQEARKTRGLIAYALQRFGPEIHNNGVGREEDIRAASDELRDLGSRLESHLYVVPYYDHIAPKVGLPTRDNVQRAARALQVMAGDVFAKQNYEPKHNAVRRATISDALGIDMPEELRWRPEHG